MDRYNVIIKREFKESEKDVIDFRMTILSIKDFEIKSILVRSELAEEIKRIIASINTDYLNLVCVTENPEQFIFRVTICGCYRSTRIYHEMKFDLFCQRNEIGTKELDGRILGLIDSKINCFYLLMNSFTFNVLEDNELIKRNKGFELQSYYKYQDHKVPVIVVGSRTLDFGAVEVVYNNEEKNLIAERSFGENNVR